MRLFFHTDALIRLLSATKTNPDGADLFISIKNRYPASLWVSPLTLTELDHILPDPEQKETKRTILKAIDDFFSVIPVTKTVIRYQMTGDGMDYQHAVTRWCAEHFRMDYLVTNQTGLFAEAGAIAISPAQLVDRFQRGTLTLENQVPFIDLKAQYEPIINGIYDRFADIFSTTGFIAGKHVEEFEKNFAKVHGADYCVGVSSGTAALHLALMMLGIGPGDQVIVPVNTFIATAEAVSLCGAKPVFVDCDRHYNIDVEKLRVLVNNHFRQRENLRNPPGIRCIIPVHLYGQPADMDEIMAISREYGVSIIEDCCQAHLAKYRGQPVGTFGDCGVFSFYPSKNIGAYGEAGAVVTHDKRLYHSARMIRNHGESKKHNHQVPGHNYRMDAFQGAVLAEKLNHINKWTRKRRKWAKLYTELLKDIKGVQLPEEIKDAFCVYHLFVIQAKDRDGLQSFLKQKGIETGIHYPTPLHMQPVYQNTGQYHNAAFPMAEQMARRILSLPIFPELTERRIHYVADCIKEFVNKQAPL